MNYTTPMFVSIRMNSYQSFGIMVALMLVMLVPTAMWYQQYWRAKSWRCLVVAFLTLATATLYQAMHQGDHSPWTIVPGSLSLTHSPLMAGGYGSMDGVAEFLAIVCYFVAVVLAMGIAGRAYRAWMLDKASEEERRGDKVGLRAWLRPMDVTSVLGVSVCAYFAMGWSPWTTGALALLVLLAYPAVNMVMANGQQELLPLDSVNAEERQRVLAMVEAGKITAEDAAELINALTDKPAIADRTEVRMTANRRMLLVGAGLLVFGFCLPWFVINVQDQMRDAMARMPQMQGFSPAFSTGNDMTLTIRGGDVPHGLGWVILACGVAAGILPLLWPTSAGNPDRQKPLAIAALVAGVVLLAYLLSGSLSTSSVGLWLATAAYAILWIGVIREYVRPTALRRVALNS